jgi:hypothetical protein
MGITSRFSSLIGGLRKQASSHHPRARVINVIDYYNEELEAFGEELACWRLPGERDHAFRHRLALHAETAKLRLEDILNHLVNPEMPS